MALIAILKRRPDVVPKDVRKIILQYSWQTRFSPQWDFQPGPVTKWVREIRWRLWARYFCTALMMLLMLLIGGALLYDFQREVDELFSSKRKLEDARSSL